MLDRRVVAIAHEYLCDTYLDLRKYPKARKHANEALNIALEVAPEGDLAAEAYRRLAEVHYHSARAEGAATAANKAIEIGKKIEDEMEVAGGLRVLAHLALDADEDEKAFKLYDQVLEICRRKNFRYELALTLEYKAFAHRYCGQINMADETMKAAIETYKDLELSRLARRLERGKRAKSRPRPKLDNPMPANPRVKRWRAHGIITTSEEYVAALEQLERVSTAPLPILLIGESGVGKELFATAGHILSGRTGRLMDVNAAAIPDTVLENELFGSRRGAFTGAEDRAGLVEAADGGTLFLDEIGELSPTLQAKLLRLLETHTYRRVGETKTRQTNVRVISATNAQLDIKVKTGEFRLDLFHRLAGVEIHIPPLRERPEDIKLLFDHFLASKATSTVAPQCDRDVLNAILTYPWPGNVRELKHAAVLAATNANGHPLISVDMLPPRVLSKEQQETLSPLNQARVETVLAKTNGSVSAAARALNISRQRLYRRAEELGLDIEKFRVE